ncbi:hypothetical protein [Halopseudomonas sabulinigri]|uniref:Uncharacterized protein n=1 Tax=Halopseudomonas sabulinigri TaxID=472181 RepID=A0ABP9ZLK3_9GAMM
MTKPIVEAIEANLGQMSELVGLSQGMKLDPAEGVVKFYGGPLLSLAYAALYFPSICLREGVPFARYATSERELPIDCFHVELVHAGESFGEDAEALASLSQVLAAAWTQVLGHNGLPGKFVCDFSSGHDVVYQP